MRPKGRKFGGIEGVVTLDEAAWAGVQSMVALGRLQRWRVSAPDTGLPAVVIFLEDPFVEVETRTAGEPSVRQVRLMIAVSPGLRSPRP